ncbi:hypothetical protein BSLG_005096 [Batrachochytrium salamandrivorans]|nr:hypothetical protein BSLG_005096 [Batrachochytrium salamandrivorans]
MVACPLTSAAGVLSLLDEPQEELKAYALMKLDAIVDLFWAESDSVSKIEVLYEDTSKHRELAALVASKRVVNLMVARCYDMKDYIEVVGIALETFRLDLLEEAILKGVLFMQMTLPKQQLLKTLIAETKNPQLHIRFHLTLRIMQHKSLSSCVLAALPTPAVAVVTPAVAALAIADRNDMETDEQTPLLKEQQAMSSTPQSRVASRNQLDQIQCNCRIGCDSQGSDLLPMALLLLIFLSGGVADSPYSEGGALCAWVINANHGTVLPLSRKRRSRTHSSEVIQHGAALGLGVAEQADDFIEQLSLIRILFCVMEACILLHFCLSAGTGHNKAIRRLHVAVSGLNFERPSLIKYEDVMARYGAVRHSAVYPLLVLVPLTHMFSLALTPTGVDSTKTLMSPNLILSCWHKGLASCLRTKVLPPTAEVVKKVGHSRIVDYRQRHGPCKKSEKEKDKDGVVADTPVSRDTMDIVCRLDFLENTLQ